MGEHSLEPSAEGAVIHVLAPDTGSEVQLDAAAAWVRCQDARRSGGGGRSVSGMAQGGRCSAGPHLSVVRKPCSESDNTSAAPVKKMLAPERHVNELRNTAETQLTPKAKMGVVLVEDQLENGHCLFEHLTSFSCKLFGTYFLLFT